MWMSISDILFTFFWILCFQLFLQYVNFLCLSSAFYPHSPYVFVSPGNLINVFSTLLSRSLIKVADRSQRKHHRNPLNMSFQAHGESVILTLTDLLAIPLKYSFRWQHWVRREVCGCPRVHCYSPFCLGGMLLEQLIPVCCRRGSQLTAMLVIKLCHFNSIVEKKIYLILFSWQLMWLVMYFSYFLNIFKWLCFPVSSEL